MAAKSLRLDIGFDTTDLLALADDLARFDPTELGELAHRVVNVVALHVNQRAVDQTVRELNLTREYVEAKIQNEQARKGGAAIAWVRSFVRGTTLQQFGAGPRTLSDTTLTTRCASSPSSVGSKRARSSASASRSVVSNPMSSRKLLATISFASAP